MDIVVRVGVGSLASVEVNGRVLKAIVGQNGAKPAAEKREGDMVTPLGKWRCLYGFYRADRVAKPTGGLFWRPMREDDGWCDEPTDPLYNQWVPKGYGASHEVMWREDSAYDYVVVLNHNQPPQAGMGSAVFMHVWREGATHTVGCVALRVEDLQVVLAGLDSESLVEITHGN